MLSKRAKNVITKVRKYRTKHNLGECFCATVLRLKVFGYLKGVGIKTINEVLGDQYPKKFAVKIEKE